MTKNVNQCLGCHSPDVAPTTGAPRVPESHFLTRDGQKTEGTSPRRYFCLQCHVQQTNVNPIIQNKFENYCKYIMIVMKINIYHQTIIMSHLCQSVQI